MAPLENTLSVNAEHWIEPDFAESVNAEAGCNTHQPAFDRLDLPATAMEPDVSVLHNVLSIGGNRLFSIK